MNLENELREALRREPAPAGFAVQVLAKAGATSGASKPWCRRPAAMALAAALVLAFLVPTEIAEYRRREQRRGIEARDQLLAALTITKTQLRHAKEQIRKNARHTL